MVWWSMFEAAKAEARWQRKDREESFGTFSVDAPLEEDEKQQPETD